MVGSTVDRIKKNLIEKAKVKKAYKKIKTSELATSSASSSTAPAATHNDAHPSSVTLVNTDSKDEDVHQHDESPTSDINSRSGGGECEAIPEQPTPPQLHPERQAMLDDDEGGGDVDEEHGDLPSGNSNRRNQSQQERHHRERRSRKPGYFDSALTKASRKKAEAEQREAERAAREAERQRKSEDRDRMRRAMAKARKPGRDGQRRLGRESGLLLERVKKMVG